MNKTFVPVRCLTPKRVVNPYTGQTLFVSCGHCKACSLNRGNHLSFLCDLESRDHKYCMFITLTYANRFIPRAKLVDSDRAPFANDLVSTDGELLCHADVPVGEVDKLLDKFYLFGYIPYLRKEDLQKFFKRFRYYAGKITKDKVRYFACGEYGPVHFRPHFHILLYFSSETLFQACEQIVCQSWPFGRYDVQQSRGQCSSYVASYVNSAVFVPKVFAARSVRPFSVHSHRMGQGFLQGQRAKVYETSVKDFIRQCVVVNEKYREFYLWRSCYAYFYPKCRGFIDKSTLARINTYRVYDTARSLYPECETAIDLARSIAFDIFTFGEPSNYQCYDIRYRDLYREFRNPGINKLDSDEGDNWIHTIYTALLLSKHFLYFVCDHNTAYEIRRKVNMIAEFYSQLDYLHLTEFFENQQLFFESDLVGSSDLMSDDFDNTYYPYFYDNVNYSIADYKSSPSYRFFNSSILEQYEKRCKHKVLNDINKLLFNE